MNRQSGKMTFMSLIAILVMAVAGYMAFKYIGSGMEKKQVKKEVFDTLGTVRGGSRGAADMTEAIEGVLQRKKIEVLEMGSELDSRNVFHYRFTYKLVTDYLLFKKSEIVEVVDQIENYN
jgi:hypothetical protein